MQETKVKKFFQGQLWFWWSLHLRLVVGIVLLLPGLAACTGSGSLFQKGQPTLFKPPPANDSTPLALYLPTATNPIPNSEMQITPLPTCTDSLVFIDDITIPDGTVVAPGERLDKRWRVENSGTCNWQKDYRLRLVSGPAMNVPEEQALFPGRSSTQVDLRMVFTAPNEDGLYRGAWQAYNPRGEPFGDPFFIEVIVQSP